MSKEWSGRSPVEGYEWKVECETDLFKDGEPFVVSLWVESVDEGEVGQSMAMLSSRQARELAAHLVHEAESTDENNKRIGSAA